MNTELVVTIVLHSAVRAIIQEGRIRTQFPSVRERSKSAAATTPRTLDRRVSMWANAGDPPVFGIVIRMYCDDHNPPHFHAFYGDSEAQVGIGPIAVLNGGLPNRAISMIFKRAAMHQRELMQNWEGLHNEQPVQRIERYISTRMINPRVNYVRYSSVRWRLPPGPGVHRRRAERSRLTRSHRQTRRSVPFADRRCFLPAGPVRPRGWNNCLAQSGRLLSGRTT